MSNTKNEIKAQIIRAGFTMQEVCDRLHGKTGADDLRLDFISCVVHLNSFLSQIE